MVLSIGAPTAAVAASGYPGGPLTVLPSDVVKGTGSSSAGRMGWLYKSAGELTKPIGLGTASKVVGNSLLPYSAYQVGSSIGATAAGEYTMQLWGVDANGLVCSAADGVGQSLLSFFSGQDCAAFNAASPAVVNNDATGSLTMKPLTWAGSTTTYLGNSAYKNPNTGKWNGAWCFKVTGSYPAGSPPAGLVTVTPDGRPDAWSVYSTSSQAAEYCADSAATFVAPGGAYGKDTEGQALAYLDATTLVCLSPFDPAVGYSCKAGIGGDFEAGVANPDRYITCDVTGTGPQGYKSDPGAMFRETDPDWSKAIPACPTLPAGNVPTNVKLVLHTVGGTDQVLWSQDVPQPVVQQLTEKGAKCLQQRCELVLTKNGQSCFASSTLCAGWYEEADKTAYSCTYDGQAVDLTECTVYAPTWGADAVRTGEYYADPVTGKPAPASGVPGEGPAGADEEASNGPVADPDSDRKCYPTGWGVFNPISWIVKPIRCVVEWAFVPRASALAGTFEGLTGAWDGTIVGEVADVTTSWTFTPPASGCGGIPIHLELPIEIPDFNVMAACEGDTLAPVAYWVKLAGNISFALGGVLAIIRYAAAAVGFTGLGGGDDD